jgi:hypothetical protein
VKDTKPPPVVQIPHDVVNESILLAAALVDADARKRLLKVKPDQFVDDDTALAWATWQAAERRGVTPTPATLVQLSGDKLDLNWLNELVATYPQAPPSLSHHIDALHWDAARVRAVTGPLAELLNALKDPTTSAERVRALARQLPVSFEGVGSRQFLRDSNQLVAELTATLEERMKGIAIYPFGLKGLDQYGPNDVDERGNSLNGHALLVPGAAPGKVTTITGISGGGKSTLAALLMLGLARQKRPCLFGAWEMGAAETLLLMACASAQISRTRALEGKITKREARTLRNRSRAIANWVRFVEMPFGKEQGARVSHDDVLDQIHGYLADSGAEVACFDLWRRAFRRMKDEADEAEALFRMQAIAEETQTHVILVQQQRLKSIEIRVNPRPTREGIKGSSAWVDVSDTILAVYMPALMKRIANTKLEVDILKQRFGRWPLAVEYDWDADLALLSNGKVVEYQPPGAEVAIGGSSTLDKLNQASKKRKAKR